MVKPGIQKLKRRQAGYSRVSDEFARDPDLTPRGTRVGLFVLSHRDGFVLTQKTIAKRLRMAETTVRAALGDLADRGYMRSWTVRDDRGYVVGTAVLMHDDRLSADEWDAEIAAEIAAEDDDDDEGTDDDAPDPSDDDETAGQALTAESTVRPDDDETAGQALTADFLGRKSLGRESDVHKGDHNYKGHHNPQGHARCASRTTTPRVRTNARRDARTSSGT